jgi:hypothetical protein
MKPPDQMTFVYLQRTGQVLAAATRQAVPKTAVPTGSETKEELAANAANELKSLVGTELFVRDMAAKFLLPAPAGPAVITSGISFPATELAVITLDFKPVLFKEARKFIIDEEKKPQLSLDPTLLVFTATATDVSVDLNAAVTKDTNVTVWVFRDDRSKGPTLLESTVDKDESPPKNQKCVMPIGLSTGDYHFLLLVQGYLAAVYERSIA